MPYEITTKDGITIRNIPDDVDPNSPELKARVASARAGNQGPAQPMQDGMMVSHTQTPSPTLPQMSPSHVVGGPLPDSVTNSAPPETTAAGLAGATTRGAGPYAASLAFGPEGPAVVAGFKIIGDPLTDGLNSILDHLGVDPKYHQISPSGALNLLMDKLGVSKPRTTTERVVQAGAEVGANALGTVGIGQQLQKAAPGTLKAATGDLLAQNPLQQVVGATTAGASSQTAKEMGFGPTGQLVAGATGGLLGGSLAQPRTLKNAYQLDTAVQNAEGLGIKPMTSDVLPPDTFGTKWLQSMGEKIPFVGTGGPRRVQQATRVQAAKDLLTEYGAGDLAQASDNVMTDLLAKRGSDLTKYTGMKTEVVDKLAGVGAVPVDRTIAEIDNQIAKLTALRTDAVNPVIARLADWRQAIQGQDLGNIETLRKQVGQAFQTPELTSVRDIGEKALTAVYKPLKEDIGNYIKFAGGTPDYNKWMVANKRLSQMAGELENDTLSRVLSKGEQTPEVVQKMLFSQKPSDARALYRGLTPDGQANARMALLSKVLEKAGGVDNLSPQKFIIEAERLGSPMGVFFRGDDSQRVEGLLRALKLTKRAQDAAIMPSNGVQAMPWVAGGALATVLGPVKGAAATAGIGGLARAYESAPVRNLLMKLPTVKPGSAEEGAIFKRLTALGVTKDEPTTTEGEQ
jgi:hypothetical protein